MRCAPCCVEEARRVRGSAVVAAVCSDARRASTRRRRLYAPTPARVLQEHAETRQSSALRASVRKAKQIHPLRGQELALRLPLSATHSTAAHLMLRPTKQRGRVASGTLGLQAVRQIIQRYRGCQGGPAAAAAIKRHQHISLRAHAAGDGRLGLRTKMRRKRSNHPTNHPARLRVTTCFCAEETRSTSLHASLSPSHLCRGSELWDRAANQGSIFYRRYNAHSAPYMVAVPPPSLAAGGPAMKAAGPAPTCALGGPPV